LDPLFIDSIAAQTGATGSNSRKTSTIELITNSDNSIQGERCVLNYLSTWSNALLLSAAK
jgi:hypothetical protein